MSSQLSEQESAAPSLTVSSDYALPSYEERVRRLKARQNLMRGILGGLVGVVISAMLWTIVALVTHLYIFAVAIVVGLIVGAGVRAAGRGTDRRFGIAAALLSLLACVLGNLLVASVLVAQAQRVSPFDILIPFLTNPLLAIFALIRNSTTTELAMYGIAALEAWSLGFIRIRPHRAEELTIPPESEEESEN